jgi:hypothetical protein
MAKLGGTGDFPRGKLNDHDEGGLQMAIFIEDKTVQLHFGKSVKWLGLDADTARKLGQGLIDKANSI